MKNIIYSSSFFFIVFQLVLINASSIEIDDSFSKEKNYLPINSKYTSSKDNFEISFSSDPQLIEERVSNILYGDYTLATYISETSKGGEMVTVSRYPQAFIDNHIESETVRGCFIGYETGLGISIQTSDFRIDNKTGKIANYKANGMYWTKCVVFSRGKLFQIGMVRMGGYPTDTEISEFMKSFRSF